MVKKKAKHETTIPSNLQHGDVGEFVQDEFFQSGHWFLKIRQVVMNILFLLILVVPVLILFNSLNRGELLKKLYFWTYSDGFDLTRYLQSVILLAVVAILVGSLAFLYRNNRRQQKTLVEAIQYDEEKLAKRKGILENFYTSRFGEKEFRESVRFYEVDGKQNIGDREINKLYKKEGVGNH